MLIYNFSVVGILTMFWHGPKWISQGYLIIFSVLLASILAKLPKTTNWILLILISFYDIFTVLSSKGPLKMLIDEAVKADQQLPFLIYSCDFIFYSLLMSLACFFQGLTITLFFWFVYEKALPALPISIFLGIVFIFD
ncbi:presenilin [Anaeramoeba ignava]|uniref:Presenilin n=1 Tax=Anaeramoeba ignava TaxID=1746090 RepID=A0A9Q0RCV2_ANAIG|nr:presenilin [Anaeramoeba ignava]